MTIHEKLYWQNQHFSKQKSSPPPTREETTNPASLGEKPGRANYWLFLRVYLRFAPGTHSTCVFLSRTCPVYGVYIIFMAMRGMRNNCVRCWCKLFRRQTFFFLSDSAVGGKNVETYHWQECTLAVHHGRWTFDSRCRDDRLLPGLFPPSVQNIRNK